jgi:hypothetical protein
MALAALAPAAATLAPASASAASGGRWALASQTRIPPEYYQGVASTPAGARFFDGIFTGLYRTDARLREKARTLNAIPPAVNATEGYNHIGDIAWDAAEGGRVLLPLECYTPGGPNGGNTCGTGSIGVVDPTTLGWRYYVKLDPGEIPKAMFCVVSPDGKLLWTSSGGDLLAYSTADISPAHAFPAAPIHSVRRLVGAVPPSGITGAAFDGQRLLVSGQAGDGPFQVWSIDLTNGSRRLEISRPIVGESEGLDTRLEVPGSAQTDLYWIVTPFTTSGRPPTFGGGHSELLHYVTRQRATRLRIHVGPPRASGRRRVNVSVSVLVGGRRVLVSGVRVRVAGHTVRSGAEGVASLLVRIAPGRYLARSLTRPGTPAATRAFAVR